MIVQVTFKAAILSNAAAVILGHNHPSGDPFPSKEDRAITTRLHQAGQLLGIAVLDHVIIGDGSQKYFSFADEGLGVIGKVLNGHPGDSVCGALSALFFCEEIICSDAGKDPRDEVFLG